MNPEKKDLYTAKRPSGVDTSNPEVKAAIEQLRSDESSVNWILLKVNSSNAVELFGAGVNGAEEMRDALDDNDIFFGALRCNVAGKVKFFHVFFVGADVSGMKKGKASMYKSAIFQLIEAHGEVSCATGLADFEVNHIIAGIFKLTHNSDISF